MFRYREEQSLPGILILVGNLPKMFQFIAGAAHVQLQRYIFKAGIYDIHDALNRTERMDDTGRRTHNVHVATFPFYFIRSVIAACSMVELVLLV